MQQVLEYSPVQTGVAYIAIAGTVVVVALGFAAKLVQRGGSWGALVVGQMQRRSGCYY